MTWSIRPAEPDDIPSLRAIEVDAGSRFRSVGLDAVADDDPPEVAALTAHIGDGTAWVAVADGATGPGTSPDPSGPVGYALASVVDGHGHLLQVSVVGDAAGQGIGRALVGAVEDWSRDRGLPAVSLTTFVDVPWNGPWYRHLGYRVLHSGELGPELAAIRADEIAAGLDLAPRAAMLRLL